MFFVRSRTILVFLLVLITVAYSASAYAKISKEIKAAIAERYTPSLPQEGLYNAQKGLERDKLRNFVVVEKGDVIPAERAFYLITPQKYDYRGAVIDGDRVKTRLGKPYIYIPRGTPMVIAANVFSGRTIYLKLLSIKKLKSPINPKKKPTRVTVMLGFKIDKTTLASNDLQKIFAKIDEWVRPFTSLQETMKYADSISVPPPLEPPAPPKPEILPDE